VRLDAIARELWAGVLSGTARIVTLTVLATIVSAGLSAADIVLTRRLIADAEAFQQAGAATLTLSAEGQVDASACKALAQVEGVRASGAIRRRALPVVASALPGAPLTAFETTPGFAAVLGSPGTGVVVPDEVADVLGLSEGDRIPTTEGVVEVGGTYPYPDDGRRPGFGWAALIETADTSPFDECWVLAWPQSDAMGSLLLGVLLPGADSERPELGQLNGALGARFDGMALFDGRLTAWAPSLAAALVGVLAFVSVRGRRLSIASDLHAGARRRDIATVMVVEGTTWLTAALILTMGSTAILAAPEALADRGALLVQGARVALASSAAGVAGIVAAVWSVRESHLVRYFKDR